jgi:hypothetical protein
MAEMGVLLSLVITTISHPRNGWAINAKHVKALSLQNNREARREMNWKYEKVAITSYSGVASTE